MSINRAERFSNDKYLTRNQVSREMGSTLIEDIWQEVLEYRTTFTNQLSLRSVEKNKFRVVLTPKISDKINQIERKLTRLYVQINDVEKHTEQFAELKFRLYKNALSNLASAYNINVNDTFYKQLIENNASAVAPSEIMLTDYYRALKIGKNSTIAPFDVNLLTKIGEVFNKIPSDNYIYRRHEIKSPSQNALIGRLFLSVPITQISEMIDDLFGFLQASTAPLFVKFSALLFFIDYVKPFEVYSEEVAIVFAKTFLAHNDLENLAMFLNYETLIHEQKERFEEVTLEVKKTSDLTYFVDFLADLTLEMLFAIDATILQIRAEVVEREQYQAPELIPTPTSKPVYRNGPRDLFDYAEDDEGAREIEEVIESKEITPKIESPVQIVESPIVKPESVITRIVDVPTELAIKDLPLSLSDDDIIRLERHLRESDPSLSKAEAYFFARHCTLGKYYTISQFKEDLGCAYETARTSMDHLAAGGYYRKEKFKNKYIYTPNKME